MKMALPIPFSLLNSEFNEFLFAQIGEEENGMPLSTLSALSRLGIDPWQEAARLSNLPRSIAAQAVTAVIARFPSLRSSSSDPTRTALDLVQLLPGAAARTAAPTRHPAVNPTILLWLVSVGLLAATLFGLGR
jgi:hypothetical protein